MSGFNTKTVSANKAVKARVSKITNAVPDTINKAGGKAFSLTPEYKLAFGLVSSFLEPEFYRSRTQTVNELSDLVKKVNPLFAAKAAVYARTQYGMRSTSHLVAAEIAKNVKGAQWTKDFFNKVVYRVDDASEILAAYLARHGKPIPNSLKKGLALGLSKFSPYQLAKYKGENKGVKLVDLFNLVHPKPSEKNADAFRKLIEGELVSEDTWEAEISAAGQNCTSEQEKTRKKNAAWKRLVLENKLGYFALLRNLRNLLQTGDTETIKEAAKQLVDEKAIKGSLVLPFRYMTALKELEAVSHDSNGRLLLSAINKALDISLSCVPVFPGETLVAVDHSGSMGNLSDPKSPASIASLFAAVLAKSNNADLILFSDSAKYVSVSLTDSLGTVTKGIQAHFRSGGTNFHSIFSTANKKYDRIIILSDMQAWIGHDCPQTSYREYCRKTKADPNIYCFDLHGYGTIQFPQEHVFSLAGFSEKTMDILSVLEQDPNAFIKLINTQKFEGE